MSSHKLLKDSSFATNFIDNLLTVFRIMNGFFHVCVIFLIISMTQCKDLFLSGREQQFLDLILIQNIEEKKT